MLGERELVGLLYRADWTRLSLLAGLTKVTDGPGDVEPIGWRPGVRVRRPPWMGPREEPADTSPGERAYRMTGQLLVAPGCRYRKEVADQDGHTFLEGCDGDRPWHQFSPEDRSHIRIFGGPEPPEPELLHPFWLLSGFELGAAEPTVVGGREGYRVVATPRRSSHGPGQAAWPRADRVEVIVDAELGILLRCEIRSAGQVQRLSELHGVALDPPEAADPAQFAPPPGSLINETRPPFFGGSFFPGPDPGGPGRPGFGGPGWPVGKAAGGLAAAGLAHLIRRGRRHAPPTEPGEAIPQDEGDAEWAREPADGPPIGDDLVYRLYQAGGTAPDFTAEFHEWFDPAVLMEMTRSAASASGRGGLHSLTEVIAEIASVTHRVSRIRVAAHDRYRIDYLSGFDDHTPQAIACDGQRRWREYTDHVAVGPADSVPHDIADLIGPGWLLAGRLSDGAEVTVGGRTGYRIRETHRAGDPPAPAALAMFSPTVAVLDADFGILVSLAWYAAGRPLRRQELRDVTRADEDPPDFDADVPPGVRVTQDAGDPFDDPRAPDPLKFAFRTVNGAARRASEGAATIAGFLDSLRGQR
jgi:hypothetical protein